MTNQKQPLSLSPQPTFHGKSRRHFLRNAGLLSTATILTACTASAAAPLHAPLSPAPRPATSDWDLSWVDRIASATDRAVFDWPTSDDPTGPILQQMAGRYLTNCATVYGPQSPDPVIVLNLRTRAVPMALADSAWERHALGVEYSVTDPATKQPAVRNPFWSHVAGAPPTPGEPTLEELVQHGAILLVCDFALGHLAGRLATKAGRNEADVHKELRNSFVHGAISVPSGIFGLARAQNAGCAYMRV